jgi:hypothetical protein
MSSVPCFYDHKIKLNCVLCLILDGIPLTNGKALVSTMNQSRFMIISPFSNVDLYITDHNKCKCIIKYDFMILSFKSGTVKVSISCFDTISFNLVYNESKFYSGRNQE